MGMELRVECAPGAASWPAAGELLAGRGYAVQVRMIDGQLAFPDEVPPADWRELRLSAAGGMVSLRREGAGVAGVGWGNADRELRRAWHALAWACAAATGGEVVTEGGSVGAAAFFEAADLPATLRATGP